MMDGMERAAVKKRLIVFIAITFTIAWIVFELVPILGFAYGSAWSVVIVMGAMFAPALGSVVTRLVTKEGFHDMYLRPRFKGHLKEYLLCFFGPTALVLVSGAVYFLLFPSSFDPELASLTAALAAKGVMALPAKTVLLINLAEMVVLGPVINLIPTLGEELGWRGYLLPKLCTLMSERAAMVLTGVIWGVWHLPVILLGHNYGTAYWGYPWLGILAMIVFCVSLGILEGMVSIKVGSAIPAAMIHSAVNAGAGLPLYLIKGAYNPVLGPALTGFVGGLPMLALAAVVLLRSGGKVPMQGAPEQT